MLDELRVGRHGDERGAALILVLSVIALLTLLAMSLLFTTDVDYHTSRNFMDRAGALNSTDASLNEVMWRMNLINGAAAPPAGSTITVNSLVAYNARITNDPMGILSNGLDDDGNGSPDDPNEFNYEKDWTVRILQSGSILTPGSPWEVSDTNITKSPWGPQIVVPTIQPMSTWSIYSTTDAASADTLKLRFMLDTDTPAGDSENDGTEIVFYNPALATNGVADKNTITNLGGNGNASTDSPYNITYTSGGTTTYASGQPVMILRSTGRIVLGGRDAARQRIEAQIVKGERGGITKALCGCTDLDLSGGGSTDSYKSSEGDYGLGTVYQNGDVGCNANIKMGGGYICSGNATSGIDQTYSGSNATVLKNATAGGTVDTNHINVLGTTTQNKLPSPTPCDCASINTAAMVAAAQGSNSNPNILPNNFNVYAYPTNFIKGSKMYAHGTGLDLTSNDSIIFPGGDYYFSDISTSGSAVLQVGVDSNGDGLVDGPPTTPVRIFVEGDISLGGGGLTNLGRPTDLLIFDSGVGDTISLSGGVEFRGMIYAPGCDVNLTGGAVFKGAVLGAAVKNTGGGAVHFDEDLTKAFKVSDQVQLLAWHEVP